MYLAATRPRSWPPAHVSQIESPPGVLSFPSTKGQHGAGRALDRSAVLAGQDGAQIRARQQIAPDEERVGDESLRADATPQFCGRGKDCLDADSAVERPGPLDNCDEQRGYIAGKRHHF